ncbi:MAG TPA: hypothetical protein VGM03_25000 [Phycisphaerae bacterium]|jgi:hypothetical protein
MLGRRISIGIVSVALLSVASAARAALFSDFVTGIEAAGFQVTGDRNPLTGSTFIQLDRAFANDTLDFGSTQLTLNGQVRTRFETNKFFPQTLDFQLNTRGAPLAYTLISDVGGQRTAFVGNALVNVNGRINAFGFYDLQINVADRQNVTSEGRFDNVTNEPQDFNIGPINVRGNIFADALAALFDPFFAASGTPNIFASFSGRTQAQQQLDSTLGRARQLVDRGGVLSQSDVDSIVGTAVISEMLGGRPADLSFLDGAVAAAEGAAGAGGHSGLVPEPATLLLMAPAIFWLGRRVGRRQF